MVPPCSDRVSRAPPYSISRTVPFRLPGYHRLWPDFPVRSTNTIDPTLRSHNPGENCFSPVWASPRSLATTRGVSVDVFSTRYLDVSVPWVCFPALWIHAGIWPKPGVSPFGNPRIIARLAAPRGLSQLATSFIASCRQGIHRMLLLA